MASPAEPRAESIPRPGELWSLWDMQELLIGKLMVAFNTVATTAQMLILTDDGNSAHNIAERSFSDIVQAATNINQIAVDSDLSVCAAASGDLMAELERLPKNGDAFLLLPGEPYARLRAALVRLQDGIRLELRSRVALMVGLSGAALWEQKDPPFGEDVARVFPLAAEDIGEAGKCLAVGRTTAVVFHLMRAMESCVQRIAARFGIGNLDREWGKLLSDINTSIESLPKGNERNSWSENFSLLYHVKQAWRNDTMHPKQTYTEEEAQEVYAAVKSFMKNLAAIV